MVKASYAGKLSVLTDMAGFLSTFWTLGQLSNSCNLLVYTILAGFNSPLIYHCEASCCLVRSVFHSIAKATPNNAATMTEKLWPCVRHLMKTLQNVPSCLALHLQQIILDQKKIDMFVFAFQGGFKVALDSNSGEKAAAAVLDLWEQLIPPSQSKSRVDAATINSMRMLSQVSGSLLSVGITALPEKMTPVVRPLMTSLQNEQDKQCQIANCNFLFTFLALLQGPAPAERVAGFHKTFAKVVSNLCNFVVSGDEPSCSTASLVIGSLVGNAPSGHSLLSFSPLSRHVLPIFESWTNSDMNSKHNALLITKAACQGLRPGIAASESIIRESIAPLTQISCDEVDVSFQDLSSDIVKQLCGVDDALVLNLVMPVLIGLLKDDSNDMHRNRACFLLGEILEVVKNPATIAPYVRILLPVVMSLMTDTIRACAETAARVFSCLVQLAPLVKLSSCLKPDKAKQLQEADLVIDHLIHGEKLPPCDIPVPITEALTTNGIVLRNYQIEGISWLRFLQSMKLNGALCDSMGLGKTLQALVAIALAHLDSNLESKRKPMSLIVCPSSVVGHWMNEIRRFFPGKKLFRSTSLIGGTNQRKAILDGQFTDCNVVVTSYAVMRGEIDKLSKLDWIYAILDEGHLLKNPKTVTARASRRLRARHRLILTGTPVMNKVQEVWATFDFLMPNFLGSSDHFLKEFARPISKGQKLDAAAFDVAAGMEKLKILHQQVLPFILRREKGQVLKELPPKIVTRIPCSMSALQGELYRHFCSGTQGKQSLITLHKLSHPDSVTDENIVAALNSNVLKSLLYLRLLCTHPWLVRSKNGNNEAMKKFFTIETSGKLLALLEIFRECGIKTQEHTAADGDSSLLYCDKDGNESLDANEYEAVVSADCTDLEDGFDNSDCGSSRCLVFAQFMDSLDVVEELVLKRFMPSVKYLRLDGRVAAAKRSNIVNNFNSDENIKVLLLTTKIGGLGLNLTGADTVIFLEHDWNPHTDLQAMDRAHRLGQKKTVHVYKLVTQNSIEETTMAIHERKLAMSSAIVNTENSSLYSMGTEKLLDIFSASAARSEIAADFEDNLDALVERYQDEYQSLSMEGFVKSFQLDDGKVKDQSA
jgi:TATA-binding protein-associated factor